MNSRPSPLSTKSLSNGVNPPPPSMPPPLILEITCTNQLQPIIIKVGNCYIYIRKYLKSITL